MATLFFDVWHCDFDIHFVASVIAVKYGHASTAIGGLDRIFKTFNRWRLKQFADCNGINHISSGITNKSWLMTRASTGHNTHLANNRRGVRNNHAVVFGFKMNKIAVGL